MDSVESAIKRASGRDAANLFKVLATLRTDVDVGVVDDWEWRGPEREFAQWAERFGTPGLMPRAEQLAEKRGTKR